MNFRPELAAKVLAGEKTVTRRLVSENPRSPWWRERCSLVAGRDYAVCPGRGKNAIGRVWIESTNRMLLGYLTDSEARAEGFANGIEFERAFEAINGSYDPSVEVWCVTFELLRCDQCDQPATTSEWGPWLCEGCALATAQGDGGAVA